IGAGNKRCLNNSSRRSTNGLHDRTRDSARGVTMTIATNESTSADNAHLRAYIQRVNAARLLSREEELELFERYRSLGDPRAKAALLGANLRYVVAIALKYRRYRVSLDEL